MKYSTVAASVLASAALVNAAPAMTKRADIDTYVLQFALTLEHLENAFYSQALAAFDAATFEKDGFPQWVRGRVSQISEHEASHVALLSSALGSAATVPCTYNFGDVSTPLKFLSTAYVVEDVGVSAYLGAAPLITNPAYLGVAGSILTTEARHQGWESSSGLHREGWASGAYDTALAPGFIYDIVAPFFVSCPSNAFDLGLTAKGATTFDVATGDISYDGVKDGDSVFLLQGLSTTVYTVSGGKITLPTVQGIAYLIPASTNNATLFSHDTSLAAPFILSVSFDSHVSNAPVAFN